jgi:hypothetical protein
LETKGDIMKELLDDMVGVQAQCFLLFIGVPYVGLISERLSGLVMAIIAKSSMPSAGHPALKQPLQFTESQKLSRFYFNPIVTRKVFPKVSKHSLEHHRAL